MGSKFCKSTKNKKAIVDRGWNPPNSNLLTDSELRATKTVDEKLTEETKVTLPYSFRMNQVEKHNLQNVIESSSSPGTTNDTSVIVNDADADTFHISSSLNFSSRISADCITKVVDAN